MNKLNMLIQCADARSLMTNDEIKSYLSEEQLKGIANNGVLVAYRTGHEGISKPNVLGVGTQLLRWNKTAIQALTSATKAGTKCFSGHNKDNSHTNRKEIGTVLKTLVRNINDKLSSIAISHIPDNKTADQYDVCSVEAVVSYDDKMNVVDVENVSGLALGNSLTDVPAFQGATALAAVQCFDNEHDNKNVNVSGDTKKEDNNVTLIEVKEYILTHNLVPSKLYSVEDLKKDVVFKDQFDAAEARQKELDERQKELDELKKAMAENAQIVSKLKFKDALEAQLKKADLTDKQKKFIQKRAENAELTDTGDDSILKHIEAEKEAFSEAAKLFLDTDDQAGNDSKKESTVSGQSGNQKTANPDELALKELGVLT